MTSQQQQVVPIIQDSIFRSNAIIKFMDKTFYAWQSIGMSPEMHPTTQLHTDAGYTFNPFIESSLVFGIGWNGHNNASHHIGWHQTFYNHQLTVSTVQKTLRKIT